MKNTLKLIASIVGLCIILLGCNKNDDTVTPTTQTQSVSLNFSHYARSETINFMDVFTSSSGAKYTLSMFRYYVSDIRLVKEDNTEQTVTGTYFLVSPNNPVCELGKVPVGNYKGVRFAIGIDSVTNHSDPTVYSASNPLAIQSPAIHWSWNSGYIFMMIEGSCDTTASNTDVLTYGQYSHSLVFHIGMDMLYSKVELSSSAAFSISADVAKQVNIKADMNVFLTNVDLKTENVTHTFMNTPLAEKAADNIPTMFSIIP